jgi:hypothetical protein
MVRRPILVVALVSAGAACVGDAPQPQTDASVDAPATDASDGGAPSDAGTGPCSPTAPFTKIEPVSELNATGQHNFGARLTADRKTLYFHRSLVGAVIRVYTATRGSVDAPWASVTAVDLGTPDGQVDSYPSPSRDGSLLYFQRRVGLSLGDEVAIWSAIRQGSGFQPPQKEPLLDAPGRFERMPYAGADGTVWLVLEEPDAGPRKGEIARATKAAAPVRVPLGASDGDESPVISADGLTLYFFSKRAPAGVWRATRTAVGAAFDAPAPIPELGAVGSNHPSWISDDQCELYFQRMVPAGDAGAGSDAGSGEGTNADGNWRIYRALR